MSKAFKPTSQLKQGSPWSLAEQSHGGNKVAWKINENYLAYVLFLLLFQGQLNENLLQFLIAVVNNELLKTIILQNKTKRGRRVNCTANPFRDLQFTRSSPVAETDNAEMKNNNPRRDP